MSARCTSTALARGNWRTLVHRARTGDDGTSITQGDHKGGSGFPALTCSGGMESVIRHGNPRPRNSTLRPPDNQRASIGPHGKQEVSTQRRTANRNRATPPRRERSTRTPTRRSHRTRVQPPRPTRRTARHAPTPTPVGATGPTILTSSRWSRTGSHSAQKWPRNSPASCATETACRPGPSGGGLTAAPAQGTAGDVVSRCALSVGASIAHAVCHGSALQD